MLLWTRRMQFFRTLDFSEKAEEIHKSLLGEIDFKNN